MRKLYHCTHCYYSFLSDQKTNQCIDCGKYNVREATNSEVWEWVRYAMEEDSPTLSEALEYVGKLAG